MKEIILWMAYFYVLIFLELQVWHAGFTSLFTVRMPEKPWLSSACRLIKALCFDGRIWAGTARTTSPSKTFFLGFTWTAPNLDCSLWEWTAGWLVCFVTVAGLWTSLVFCDTVCMPNFLQIHFFVHVWDWIIGGVWPGKQWRE